MDHVNESIGIGEQCCDHSMTCQGLANLWLCLDALFDCCIVSFDIVTIIIL